MFASEDRLPAIGSRNLRVIEMYPSGKLDANFTHPSNALTRRTVKKFLADVLFSTERAADKNKNKNTV